MTQIVISGRIAELLQAYASAHHQSIEEKQPQVELDERTQMTPRGVILRTYDRARRRWRELGEHAKAEMTDGEMDQQFWLIDHEGIPRLKSEEGTIDLPPDPLMLLLESAEKLQVVSSDPNLSEHTDDEMNDLLDEKYARTLHTRKPNQ